MNRLENYMNDIKEYNVQGTIRRMRIFTKIQTLEEAYLIGYLLGDGGYNKETSKRNARLFVSSIDEKLIYELNQYFTPDSSISSLVPINKTRNIVTDKESFKFTFPANFKNTFSKFGVLSVKKDRNYFNIPKEFMPSLLAGLLDADGFISFGRRKDRNRLWSAFVITHQNGSMLSKLQNYLADELGVVTTLKKRADEDCWDLKTSKPYNVKKVVDFVITECSLFSASKRAVMYRFLKEYATFTG